jgi:hypothetical protein
MFGSFNLTFNILATVLATFTNIGHIFCSIFWSLWILALAVSRLFSHSKGVGSKCLGSFNLSFDILATVLATFTNIGHIFVQFSGHSGSS